MIGLTHRSATALAAAIRAREVTSRAVVDAHLDVVARRNPQLRAIVVERGREARAEADAADARIAAAAADAPLPPLLGVPCTIKETIGVEGLPHCGGVVAREGIVATETAPVARRLLDAGAILLGLTNTSELAMWIETENRLYGRTRNPYDARHTAGGSSGGEGAAVGAGMAPVGLGSDVGGSIRIPAACCGVFGHKPSYGLLPLTGAYPEAHGETTRLLVNGPLARRAEDLMPLLRLLAGPDGRDPAARAMPLGDPASVDLRGLRVGVTDDAFLSPIAREVLDARERAAGALAAAGARVEHVSMRAMRTCLDAYLAALSDGGRASAAELFAAEGVASPGLRGLLARGGPHTVATRLLLATERLTARMPERRIRRLLDAGRRYAEAVHAEIGDGVLLHPPMPGLAPRHGRTVGRVWWMHPAAVFNLASVPVTEVPLGLSARGLPLGVQVAAGPGRDHVSIAVALELERVFGGWVPPPR